MAKVKLGLGAGGVPQGVELWCQICGQIAIAGGGNRKRKSGPWRRLWQPKRFP